MKWTLVLRLGLATAGVLLAARALFGPFDFPVAVHSPINAEGWFAIAAALLVGLRLQPSGPDSGSGAVVPPARPWFPAAGALAAFASLLGLIAVAFSGSLHDYFLADDFILLHYARDFVFDLHRVFSTGGGDGFFRPITNLLFGLTFRWAGTNPLPWHLEGLALHALNTALVFVIVRETGSTHTTAPSGTAWFAAALFAIHGTRPEAVVWTAGRFDLLAAFFVLLSIALYLRSGDCTGAARALYWTASLAAMALGILSKESAYAGPPILALIEVMRQLRPAEPTGRRSLPERLRALALPIGPFFALAVGLFAYRWVLFGGIGGYLDPSGRPQALLLTPVSIVKTLGFRIWAVLTFPLDWDAGSGPAVGLAMVLYLAALAGLTTARARARDLIAPLGFVLLASIPPLQQLLIGPGMDKSRYLYLPAVGFCWLLAALAARLAPIPRRAICAAVLLFNLVALEYNLSAWKHVATLTRPACIAAASCVREHPGAGGGARLLAIGVPRWIHSAYLFPLGFPDCTRMELARVAETAEVAPIEVAMRDGPPDARPTPEEAAAYSCVLAWDPATEQLRQVR